MFQHPLGVTLVLVVILVDSLGKGVIVLDILVLIVIEAFVQVVVVDCRIDFDIEFDHIGTVVGFEGDDENKVTIGLGNALQVVAVAFRVGLLEEFHELFGEIFVADNQSFFSIGCSTHNRLFWCKYSKCF